jgi:hypothetical protein
MRNGALALAMVLLTIPAAGAIADEGRSRAAAPTMGSVIDASGPIPSQPPFALAVAFGAEALGGAGQCGNPSERASHHCKLRLTEGGPSAIDPPDRPITAVGVRFEMRF